MTIDLYYTPSSTPSRTVSLVVSALGIADKINYKNVNLMAREHLKPEFLKINPQHTVPTLVDDGFVLWESRAICRYLVDKYGGANNSLYPADIKSRAVVDSRLDFALGTLQTRFAVVFAEYFGIPPVEGSREKVKEALGFLNTFLEGQKYVAGDNMTIADSSLVPTVSNIEAVGIDLNEYPNVVRWYELMKTTAPNYNKANAEPLELFKAYLTKK